MNKYLQQPDAIYDLHGARGFEVPQILLECLQRSEQQNHQIIHVIVGKGNRSLGAPVVRTLAQEYFNQHGYQYRFAKRHEGGEGVIVVTL